jgi:uncharacterized protein
MVKILYFISLTFLAALAGYLGYYVINMTDLIETKVDNYNFLVDDERVPKYGTASVLNSQLRVEIADTPQSRQVGLMRRSYLAENIGMLFIFDSDSTHSMWMKDTRIPLDIAWIDSGGRIVHIEREVQPCVALTCPTYSPSRPARYVLETNAGWLEKNRVFVGAYVSFSL